ncbi:MAG TPA: CCA tRNA nucleotidyltransferase [Gemmatimonadaceae bacterium]|nr:CCA tRNA nucleotidyltransferase [Gemmatimonadaceae bacterium]
MGRKIALHPPEEVLEICDTLERHGYDTWCVGGAVRDALLGLPNSDWDIATTATPQQVRQLFRRTVPVGESHGTIGVLDRDNRMHEVTTFRRDVNTDGRHAEVAFGASLDEDLARRDFTINAIAYKPRQAILHDPFGGREDLARGVIRAVGDPEARMREDRLRALRGIRFAARFEFTIDPATWGAIRASAPHLTRLSAERVSQELEKTMEQVRLPGRALRLWKDSGALASLIPPLAGIDEVTLTSLDCLPLPRGPRAEDRKWNRVSALFWGLDGPTTYRAVVALRFPTARAKWMAHLAESWQVVRRHLTTTPTDAVVRTWVSIVGRTQFADFWRIAATRLTDAETVRSVYRRGLRIAYGDTPVAIADLALNGDDLIRLGIPKGPEIRDMLQEMLRAVLDDPTLNTADRLRAFVASKHA